MPKGEFRFSRNAERVSAMPSPSASRSSVMRLALGTPAPAFFWKNFITFAFAPFPSKSCSMNACPASGVSGVPDLTWSSSMRKSI